MAENIYKQQTDEMLVDQYRQTGSHDIFKELFQRYYHLVYGVCMKYFRDSDMAKDQTMLVFEKLMQDLQKHEIQFFKGWLYRVAQNQCLMQLRSQKHRIVSFEAKHEPGVEFADEVHPAIAKENLINRMEQAMLELTQDQQYCIRRFFLDKKSYQEIMEESGYTFMQVKSYIQNGKRNLKLKLSQHGQE